MGYNRDMRAYAGAHRSMVIRNDTITDELYQRFGKNIVQTGGEIESLNLLKKNGLIDE